MMHVVSYVYREHKYLKIFETERELFQTLKIDTLKKTETGRKRRELYNGLKKI